MNSSKLHRTIGIDLGGTKISFLDMYTPENIITELTVKTPTTLDDLVSTLTKTIKDLIHVEPNLPVGIGIAVAGQINQANKSIIFSPNLPIKTEFPLGTKLEDALNLPVSIENDANAAAIGEKVFGAAKDIDDFIMLTLGTGVGAGIFVGGRLLTGSMGAGGEAGHILIDPNGPKCGCGANGCLEAFASGTAIARMAKDSFVKKISARDLSLIASDGDLKAMEIFEKAGERLGDGLVTLINLFNPAAIFFCGSLTNAPNNYFIPAFQKVRNSSFGTMGAEVILETSKFSDNIGVIGAASLPIIMDRR